MCFWITPALSYTVNITFSSNRPTGTPEMLQFSSILGHSSTGTGNLQYTFPVPSVQELKLQYNTVQYNVVTVHTNIDWHWLMLFLKGINLHHYKIIPVLNGTSIDNKSLHPIICTSQLITALQPLRMLSFLPHIWWIHRTSLSFQSWCNWCDMTGWLTRFDNRPWVVFYSFVSIPLMSIFQEPN